MRKFFVVGNMKMNLLSREEATQYVSVLKREARGKRLDHTVGILCPPFVFLADFAGLPEGFARGAQDMFWEKSGAYTGEISPVMLKNEGVEYVLIGHSERREYGGETDAIVKQKTLAAIKHLLNPIVCFGETERERRTDQAERALALQVEGLFGGFSKLQAEKVILAYEPRWAVGSDRLPTTEEILRVRVLVRKLLTERYDAPTADRVAILYGGSVKSAFLGAVSWEAGMDGVLVGRESLFPYEIVKMMSLFEERAEAEAAG